MKIQDLGEGTDIIWVGNKGIDEVVLNEEASSLIVSGSLEHDIELTRREIEGPLGGFVGQLWRYESSEENNEKGLVIRSSHTDYAVHYELRKRQNQERDSYALPIGVNPLLELTEGRDSYILLGLIDEHSDHPGLALAGSTFIYRSNDKNKPDETIKNAILRGITTKTSINKEDIERPVHLSRIIGLVYTEDTHDVGIVTYVPFSNLSVNEVNPAGNYDRVLFLPKHFNTINELIRTGQYDGLPATDQLRGSLFVYQHQNALGNLQK